jgi:hypothetical protein
MIEQSDEYKYAFDNKLNTNLVLDEEAMTKQSQNQSL